MNEQLNARCELFIKNQNAMKEGFFWSSSLIYPLCSILYTSQNKTIEIEQIKSCKELIKKNSGVFSSFRSLSELPLATALSLEANPEETIQKTMLAYSALKSQFWSSVYLPFCALNMAQSLDESYLFDEVARTAKDFYNEMKSKHFFLTGQEDCGNAVLFAINKRPVYETIEESEKCYKILKNTFSFSNGVQSLGFVLSLSNENAESKCQKIIDLYHALREEKRKYGTYYELATLGIFGLFELNTYELVSTICQVDDFLKTQKGFGTFGLGSRQRLLYAAMLSASEYTNDTDLMAKTALTGITELILAQQAATMACISSASVAAAAASSGS